MRFHALTFQTKIRRWVFHGDDNDALKAPKQKGIFCEIVLAYTAILFTPAIIGLKCYTNLTNSIR
jgi:hypothetical protein